MRKFLRTTKALLVAAGLCVGASAWAVDVPEPKYFNDFSSTTGLTIVGNGEFITDADPAFGQVFHNDPANASAVRTNYLKLPTTVFKDFTTDGGKTAMTIGFWVNKKGENDFFYTPLFAAYNAAPSNGNTLPMFVCETRGLIQLNCNGYCDFGINDQQAGTTYNDGTPYVSTVWLDDGAWHYYTVVLTKTTAKVYVDGDLKNEWTVDGTSEGQVISGLFTGAATELTYVTLGGNQAWNWADPDPAFAFDDFAVYGEALSTEQIAQIISNKGKAASTYSITYDFKSFVESGETSSNLTASSKEITGYTKVYTPNEFSDELGGKLAFADATDWNLQNNTSNEGLYWYNASDKHFSIVNLKAGDKVTVTTTSGTIYFATASQCTGTHYSKNDKGSGTYKTEESTANEQWDQLKSGETLTIMKDCNLNLQAKRAGSFGALVISSIVITPSQAETMTAPSISSVAADGGRNVTITSGTSNMLSGVTTYYTTNGSTPTSLSTKYTGTFLQATDATVKAITISNSSAATASSVSSQLIEMETLDSPVLEVTGTYDNNRIVTITCPTDGATIYYSETEKTNAEDGWLTYSAPVSTAATTLYAYAAKSGNKTTVVSIATGAGTTYKLNAPTFSKDSYSAGNYTVTISQDQSSLTYVPASPVIKYSIDGGGEQTYSSAIAVPAGSTVTAHVEAEGYGNSSGQNCKTGLQPTLEVNWTQNYVGLTATDVTMSQESDDSRLNCVVSNVGGNYCVYSSDNTNASTNANAGFETYYNDKNPRKWIVRPTTGGGGMYNLAAGNAGVGIANLTTGQIIKIEWTTSSYGGLTVNSGTAKLDNISYGSVGYFEATADGTAYFTAARNVYVKNITVYDLAVAKTISDAGWSTYCSPYILDFSSSIANLDAAYIVTGGADGVLTKTEVNGAVPAGTGLLLKGTASVNVEIPVAATSTVNVGDNKLVGVTASQTLAANGGYVLMTSPSLAFYKNINAFTLSANSAYLPAGFDDASARSAFLIFGDESTGIDTVNSEELKVKSFYNLSGQRVAAPQKGLYIVNGKKVVLK